MPQRGPADGPQQQEMSESEESGADNQTDAASELQGPAYSVAATEMTTGETDADLQSDEESSSDESVESVEFKNKWPVKLMACFSLKRQLKPDSEPQKMLCPLGFYSTVFPCWIIGQDTTIMFREEYCCSQAYCSDSCPGCGGSRCCQCCNSCVQMGPRGCACFWLSTLTGCCVPGICWPNFFFAGHVGVVRSMAVTHLDIDRDGPSMKNEHLKPFVWCCSLSQMHLSLTEDIDHIRASGYIPKTIEDETDRIALESARGGGNGALTDRSVPITPAVLRDEDVEEFLEQVHMQSSRSRMKKQLEKTEMKRAEKKRMAKEAIAAAAKKEQDKANKKAAKEEKKRKKAEARAAAKAAAEEQERKDAEEEKLEKEAETEEDKRNLARRHVRGVTHASLEEVEAALAKAKAERLKRKEEKERKKKIILARQAKKDKKKRKQEVDRERRERAIASELVVKQVRRLSLQGSQEISPEVMAQIRAIATQKSHDLVSGKQKSHESIDDLSRALDQQVEQIVQHTSEEVPAEEKATDHTTHAHDMSSAKYNCRVCEPSSVLGLTSPGAADEKPRGPPEDTAAADSSSAASDGNCVLQ